MATATKATKAPRMSDEAVKAKTGKVWREWFAILDQAGAKEMAHGKRVKLLKDHYGLGPWWQQMVTVTYEQQRGLREQHEMSQGYQISVSRTVNAPLSQLYKTSVTEKSRALWLAEEGLVVRRTTPNKSMRVTWKDGKSSLEINFYSKGPDKSQVVVQHSKLADAKSATRMKTYWKKALDRLRELLEN